MAAPCPALSSCSVSGSHSNTRGQCSPTHGPPGRRFAPLRGASLALPEEEEFLGAAHPGSTIELLFQRPEWQVRAPSSTFGWAASSAASFLPYQLGGLLACHAAFPRGIPQ